MRLILIPLVLLPAALDARAAPGQADGGRARVEGGRVARGPLRDFAGERVWRNAYPDAPVSGRVIERVRARCATSCVWVGRASTSTIIRDAEFTREGRSSWRKIDAGIKVGGTKGGVPTAGVLIERVYAHGWRQAPHKGYANGDGVVVNRDVRDVTIRDSVLADNSDAGLDTKADWTVVEDVTLSGNGHYGLRGWAAGRGDRIVLDGNAWGGMEFSAGARWTFGRVAMIGPGELVTSAEGAEITFTKCPDLSRWTGDALTKGKGRVTFPPGCRLGRNAPRDPGAARPPGRESLTRRR